MESQEMNCENSSTQVASSQSIMAIGGLDTNITLESPSPINSPKDSHVQNNELEPPIDIATNCEVKVGDKRLKSVATEEDRRCSFSLADPFSAASANLLQRINGNEEGNRGGSGMTSLWFGDEDELVAISKKVGILKYLKSGGVETQILDFDRFEFGNKADVEVEIGGDVRAKFGPKGGHELGGDVGSDFDSDGGVEIGGIWARRATNGRHAVGDTLSDPLILISEEEEPQPLVIEQAQGDHYGLHRLPDLDYLYHLNHVFDYHPLPPPEPLPPLPNRPQPLDHARFMRETFSSSSSNFSSWDPLISTQLGEASGPRYAPSPPNRMLEASRNTAYSTNRN
nr:hypothetical protein Iba_chr15cCG5790 [Ipomoea batatas]